MRFTTKYIGTSHYVDAQQSDDLERIYSFGNSSLARRDFEGPGRYRLYIHTINEYDEYAGIETHTAQ
jgi:hypothetical protein